MKNFVFSLLVLTSFCCCKNNHSPFDKNIKNINKQINSLKTVNDKKHFLNELYLSSQGKVEEIDSLEKNIFKNHTEVYKLRHELDSMRAYNAYKSEKYLDLYPYPTDTITYTKNEFYALYFALLHSSRVNSLLKGLPYIKKQYEDGGLSGKYFLKYLNLIYYLDKTQFYQFNKKHALDQLIQDILPEIEEIKKNKNIKIQLLII
ncbi:MAG TPA: hypothetical protein VGA80_15170 [Flavobacteriaceae bacterium]|jgi:hypothetical protein